MEMLDGLIIRNRRRQSEKEDGGKLVDKFFGATYRSAIRGFKGLAEIMPDNILIEVWSDVLKFFNMLIIRNAIEQEKAELQDGDISPLAITFSKCKDDIKKGNW